MSVCPLPSGPEPEDSSKTGSGPPEAETRLCHPAKAGEEEGWRGWFGCPWFCPLEGAVPWLCLIPFLLSSQIFWEQVAHIFSLFIHSPPGMRGLSIPRPCTAERGPATSLPAGGFAGSWGILWLLGSSWSWGAWGAWGSPGSSSDPGGMLPRGFPAVSSLQLLPEPPAKPEGTGSDRGEEISWAVSQGAGLVHWGLCHRLGPHSVPGDPSERT